MQVPCIRNRMAPFIIVALAALFLFGGCTSGTTTQQKAGQATNLTSNVKKYELGGVEYSVTWENPGRSTSAPLKFTVKMDTHSGSLSKYDLGKSSTLVNDRGLQVRASQWDSPGSGHHGTGALYFPPADSAGKSLINADTKYVDWVIGGLAGATEKKTVRWEITQ